MLDETEFLSPYGIRALSRVHQEHPYVCCSTAQSIGSTTSRRESTTGAVRRQLQLARAGLVSGQLPADRVAAEVPPLLRRRLQGRVPDRLGPDDEAVRRWRPSSRGGCHAIFLRDDDGRRPVYGGIERFQTDPHWRDLMLFHEYFHGDNGAGLGASHQTGWTGLVAKLLQQSGE